MTSDKSKSRALAEFTANLSWEAIPDSVKHRAKLQILDAIGVGVAARSYPFAEKALSGVKALGGSGVCSVCKADAFGYRMLVGCSCLIAKSSMSCSSDAYAGAMQTMLGKSRM